jgi:hypothetical protein
MLLRLVRQPHRRDDPRRPRDAAYLARGAGS